MMPVLAWLRPTGTNTTAHAYVVISSVESDRSLCGAIWRSESPAVFIPEALTLGRCLKCVKRAASYKTRNGRAA